MCNVTNDLKYKQDNNTGQVLCALVSKVGWRGGGGCQIEGGREQLLFSEQPLFSDHYDISIEFVV